MDRLFTDETFKQQDFATNGFPAGEYENCKFLHCDFSNVSFAGCIFVECAFSDCNLSMVQLNKTAMRDVRFVGCKMLGLHFDTCNDFGFEVSFDGCNLQHASFYNRNLKKLQCKNTILREVDFTLADLSQAVLQDCDLIGATFDNTNLEKADLRKATGYIIDPERNKIKKAKFSLADVAGLLMKYDITIE
ncbi:pentapeptide repeat-containing protein [Chitinophaga sp. Cy-1792]|uniref:pentapeptide repeat-containing protein n=1 Tax=Chitinophaga sp. Cy-1792 TaxID=2608339 RepID=UPI001423A49B|nr:pentapeptide repeat-containing protein [Chitinophaga sp. Cy-1792]NIG54392.1 pentapeptide repeat-containing protein [Chitinophaga sp. Cy-1792]